MIRHRQAFVGGHGSCFATAVACVLDLDLASVPNFVAFGNGRWYEALLLWCKSQRVHFRVFYLDGKKLRREGGKPARHPGKPVVASGQGPRGYRHAVVYQRGRFLHDPFPGDAGLVGAPERFWEFRRCRAKRCKKCDGKP